MKRHRRATDFIFNLSTSVGCVLLACLLAETTVVSAHPVQMYRAIGHNIRQFTCVGKSSSAKGVCMFAWDCIKANGTHLGTCIDRFYFGSCCQVRLPANTQIPESVKVPTNDIDDELDLPPSLPAVLLATTTKVSPEVVTALVTSSSVEESQASSSTSTTTTSLDPSTSPAPQTNSAESSAATQPTAEQAGWSTVAPSHDTEKVGEASTSVESSSTSVEVVPPLPSAYPTESTTWSASDATSQLDDDVTAQLLNGDDNWVTTEEEVEEVTTEMLTSEKTTAQPATSSVTSSPISTSSSTAATPATTLRASPPTTAPSTPITTEMTNAPITTPTTTSTTATTPVTTTTTERPTTTVALTTTTELPTTTQEVFDASKLAEADYESACGRQLYKARPTGRIVNGQKSEFGEWPWQISLRQWKRTTFMHKCGAALLNENWAITAAHCVDSVPPEDLLLRIGEFDLSSDGEGLNHVERRVQIMTTHPEFNSRTFENDLALLRFYEPVTFRENIIPICLPTTNDTFVNKTGFVTGWGRLYVDGPLPNILQEVQVPVITNHECEQEYRKAGFLENIPDIFLCAGYDEGGRDSCEGDSGGPLVIKQDNNRWLLAGIISWGIGCAEPHQPGVYTRISKFRDWINQILVF